MSIPGLFILNPINYLRNHLRKKLPILITVTFICLSFHVTAAASDEISGELDVIHKDDFDSYIHLENDYFLRDDNGVDWYQLQFDRAPPAHLRSGQRIKAKGQQNGCKFRVESLEEEAAVKGKASNGESVSGDYSGTTESSDLTYAQAIDERRAVVIMVDLANAETASYITPAQVAGRMFTDTRSIDGLYRAASLAYL